MPKIKQIKCENFLCLNQKTWRSKTGCRINAPIESCQVRTEFLYMNFDFFGRLNKIHKYFGKSTRIEKLKEECLEFLKDPSPGEMADIWSVVNQIYLNDEKVRSEVKRKLKRTESRINSGVYKEERGE